MGDLIFVVIFGSIFAYWIYCHVSFRSALKTYEPKMYEENRKWSPLHYTAGIAWVDLALSKGYLNSSCSEVVKSGDRLAAAYEAKFKFIGYGLLLSSFWHVGLWIWISFK